MQARWLRLTVRDSRTPITRTQKLSRRLLRNERGPRRVSRKAAVTSRLIRTPMWSSDESEILRSQQALTEKRRVPCPLRQDRRARHYRLASNKTPIHTVDQAERKYQRVAGCRTAVVDADPFNLERFVS